LSLPQQVMMTLFSLFALVDSKDTYKASCQALVHRRLTALYRGLGFPMPENPNYSAYYITFDLMLWARLQHDEDFCRFLAKNHEPVDLIFRMAEKYGVVLMDGGGFGGPKWSFRISLANLPDETYERIGDFLMDCAQDYVAAWELSCSGRTAPLWKICRTRSSKVPQASKQMDRDRAERAEAKPSEALEIWTDSLKSPRQTGWLVPHPRGRQFPGRLDHGFGSQRRPCLSPGSIGIRPGGF
jgi:aspartate 4-decarboxylase